MAKSSRSKWKKQHRRLKADKEKINATRRLKKLHKKLKLTAVGGISQVPSQEPEKRFHFLNPELDPNVPNTRATLNNNYRAEVQTKGAAAVAINFKQPLRLRKPTTDFHGKSDPNAPHPTTFVYDEVSALAPIAGRALTKDDMERLAALSAEEQARVIRSVSGNVPNPNNENEPELAEGDMDIYGLEKPFVPATWSLHQQLSKAGQTSTRVVDEDDEDEEIDAETFAQLNQKKNKKSKNAEVGEDGVEHVEYDLMMDDDDGPEEYTFGLEDALPTRVKRSGGGKVAVAKAPAIAAQVPKAARKQTTAAAASKIKSMENAQKKNNVVIAASGTAKLKQLSSATASSTRVVSSGSKAAAKKTAGKKVKKK